jgi:putative acetyltransferase
VHLLCIPCAPLVHGLRVARVPAVQALTPLPYFLRLQAIMSGSCQVPKRTCSQIREFQEMDLAAVRRLIHETIDACYAGVYPPRAVQFFKEFHSEEKIMARHREGQVLVVEQEGRLVATGTIVRKEIFGVFVHPDFQGRGHGTGLMRELENRAKASGCAQSELSVSLPSKGFYDGLGYKIQEECSIDVGEGQQLRFWKASKPLMQRTPLGEGEAAVSSCPSPRPIQASAQAIDTMLPGLKIFQALTSQDIDLSRTLFQEYAAAIGIDLSFQGFAAELAGLPGLYAPPRGRLLLALADNGAAGCVALRPLGGRVCEMKRLFVRPAFRGQGFGKRLAQRVIAEARVASYTTMKLDTLASMQAAISLYEQLGFVRCAAYYETPLSDTVFMELNL